MRAERRRRAVRVCSVVNHRKVGGAGERTEAEGEARNATRAFYCSLASVSATRRLDSGSPVSGDVHAGF